MVGPRARRDFGVGGERDLGLVTLVQCVLELGLGLAVCTTGTMQLIHYVITL